MSEEFQFKIGDKITLGLPRYSDNQYLEVEWQKGDWLAGVKWTVGPTNAASCPVVDAANDCWLPWVAPARKQWIIETKEGAAKEGDLFVWCGVDGDNPPRFVVAERDFVLSRDLVVSIRAWGEWVSDGGTAAPGLRPREEGKQ